MGLFSKKKSQPEQAYAPPRQSYAPPQGAPPPQAYGQQQQQQFYAPPPQSYAPPQHAPPPQQYQHVAGGKEDPLKALAKFDTTFLIDDSGSMEMFWEESLSPALASVIQAAAQYDDDGVDICFFNDKTRATSKSSQELMQLFRRVWPSKSTPTADALSRVLDPYISDLENWVVEGKPAGYPRPKPLNLIILTDGAPDRGQSPEMIIVDAAKRLDKIKMPPFQLGIQFVQIGVDEEAADHLRALDDDLKAKHKIRDIVDTTLFDVNNGKIDHEYLMKALLGGVNKTIDNKQ